MTNFDVVKKLIGEIRPVGDAAIDPQRLENLKAMCELMDEIHSAIDAVAYDFKDDKQGSVKACCDYATKFLDKLFGDTSIDNAENIKQRILSEHKNGNIVVASFEGLSVHSLNDIINQPTDGLLYDLNRNEAVILTMIKDPKWINDYASTQVIRTLKDKLDKLQNTEKPKECCNQRDVNGDCVFPNCG